MSEIYTCEACLRPFTDARGCDEPNLAFIAPTRYGEERYPGAPSADQCQDCGAGRGGWHHPGCDEAACTACGRQWHGATSCEEDALLTSGGVPA